MFKHFKLKKESIVDDMPIGFSSHNSWYIRKPHTSCRSLFEGKKLPYDVQVFICKCGEQSLKITQKNQKRVPYKCANCNNSHFFDVNNYSNRYNDLLVNVNHETDLSIEKEYAHAKLYVSIPINIDLSNDKIKFQKKLVYNLRICLNGGEERHQEQHILSCDVTDKAYRELLSFIDKHYLVHKLKDYDILDMNNKTGPQYRKIVKFFLQFPYFHDAAFASWKMDNDFYNAGGIEKTTEKFLSFIRHRTEKSIIKSLYSRYLHEIEVSKFDPFVPYIICRMFKDPNHVCTLLNNYELILTHYTTNSMIDLAKKHMRLLEFLLEQYSEKAIVNIFNKMGSDPMYWEDSVSMFDTILELELTSRHFNRPKANIKAIHDELIRAQHLSKFSSKKVTFTYHYNEKQSCGLWHDKFYVLLPENSDELIQWSQHLKNCLYGYVPHVFSKETTVFGIKRENQLVYVIEIRDNRIEQMYGKHNSIVKNPRDRSTLLAWYKTYFNENIADKQNTLEHNEG